MTETGKRYGTSLYELAAEEGLTERILAELDVAVNAMQEPGYLRLLMTPSVPKKERCVLLDQAFAQAHPYLVNFLKILCEAGILPELPACARAYRDRYNQDHNILEVTAVSAVALDESARSRLQEKIAACNRQNHYPDGKSGPQCSGRSAAGSWRNPPGRHCAGPAGTSAQ